MKHYIVLMVVLTIGIFLRFWGLGNVGLHGDEETMALPALGLLDDGYPALPSGMTYARALGQLFLMTASAKVFGVSEFAWRFPSAVVGSVMLAFAFLLGRRFLLPWWNIVFVAVLASLPQMIAVSQTARMYVFLAAGLILFAVLVMRWSETQRSSDWVAAIVVFIVTAHFHRLAVFSSFLWFLPCFLCLQSRLLRRAIIGWLISILGWSAIDFYVDYNYPRQSNPLRQFGDDLPERLLSTPLSDSWLLLILAAAAACLPALLFANKQLRSPVALGGILLAGLGLAAGVMMNYHSAALLLSGATILLVRERAGRRPILLVFSIAGGILAIELAAMAISGQLADAKTAVKDFLGLPSIWPYLNFAWYFPVAAALYMVPLSVTVFRVARGKTIPDYFLLFFLGVIPVVLGVGFFRWDPPPRYLFGAVPFFVLAFLSSYQDLLKALPLRLSMHQWVAPLAVVCIYISMIRPVSLYHNVNIQYSDFPYASGMRGVDHKGAAEFIESLALSSSTVLIAEDVLQQTYYLGKVDYWLRSFEVSSYAVQSPDGYRDIYTGTIKLGTPEMLADALEREQGNAIYVIGSGETAQSRQRVLGEGILRLLEQYDPEIVYEGRDGMTKVYLLRKSLTS